MLEKLIYDRFIEINNMGFIKSKQNGKGGIGRTLEELLNISENNYMVSDLFDIEIKASNYELKLQKISFFSITPKGDSDYEIERLYNTYGYTDKFDIKNKKFNINLYCTRKSLLNNLYYSLKINKEEEKIYLCIQNKYGETIEMKTYWEFKEIYRRLELKLLKIAFFEGRKKIIENDTYFKYEKLTFYKLKNKENFIEAIEKGYIGIMFSIGTNKTTGLINDHGTKFFMWKENFDKIFDKYEVDHNVFAKI